MRAPLSKQDEPSLYRSTGYYFPHVLRSNLPTPEKRPKADDNRIVSHDASRLGLYYHCVRDVIIYFTLSGWNHGVLSRLSEWITVWIAWLCFQGYRFNLYSLRFQWEFCRYSEEFYFRFVGLSRSTYKLCGKHMQTKKISHRFGCCEFACGRIIRWGKKPWADTNIKVLLVISRYKASQDSAIVSGLLKVISGVAFVF